MRTRNIIALAAVSSILAFAGCTPEMQQFGSSILSSTGLVSSSQANALFEAGGKLAKAATPLSEEEEYYLGRGVSAVILSKYKPYQNAGLTSYVNRVGAVVAASSGRPSTFGGYHFLILDTPEVNALSAPGGFVFVSRGLLKAIPDEDALAAVLAHEVGHIARGHGVAAISQANLTQALTIMGKEAAASQAGFATQELTAAFGDSIKDVVNSVLTQGYSRSQEYEADSYSANLLQISGYSPSALLDMLKALKTLQASHPEDVKSGWFETHPSPEDRIDEISSEIRGMNDDAAGRAVRAKRFAAAAR